MKVWPFVVSVYLIVQLRECDAKRCIDKGFVHASDERGVLPDEPFPSLDMNTLRCQASPVEVATTIHLPLKFFASPTRIRTSEYRAQESYWVIDVTDLVQSAVNLSEEERSGRIEVWGLTGWYISMLMKVLQVYR